MNSNELLIEIKKCLQVAFKDRLKGVVLYGSEARGEASADSDIDILILLDGPVHLWRELQTSIHALYPLSLSCGRPISSKPVNIERYKAAKCPLYINAQREGISA